MIEIKFPSSLSMDFPGVVAAALEVCRDVPQDERLTIDLTDTEKVSAFGVAALGARLDWLVRTRRMPAGSTVRRPENGRVSNQLMRMGLYRLINESSEAVYRDEKPEVRPQELLLIDKPQELVGGTVRLCKLLRGILPSTESDYEKIAGMMQALGNNVFRHAKSPTGVVLCAQGFPRSGYIEFAAADTGVGIRESLKRFPQLSDSITSDSQALLTALTLKVAQAEGAPRPGTLSRLVATMRQLGGEIVALSGDAVLVLRNGEMRSSQVKSYPGTVIGLRFKMFRD